MPSRVVTISLLEALYARTREAMKASSLSLEEALTQFLSFSSPELENDWSSGIRSELGALPLYSDAEHWDIANATMDDELQTQLDALAELQTPTVVRSGEDNTG